MVIMELLLFCSNLSETHAYIHIPLSPFQEPDPTSREIKELQTRNNKLQAQVDALQAQCEEGEERQLLLTQKLRMEMRELHDRHRQEVATSLSASQKPAAEFPTAYWSSLFLNESNTVLCGPNPSLKTVRAVVGDYWNRLVDVLK